MTGGAGGSCGTLPTSSMTSSRSRPSTMLHLNARVTTPSLMFSCMCSPLVRLGLDARPLEDFTGDAVGWLLGRFQHSTGGTDRPSSCHLIASIRPSIRVMRAPRSLSAWPVSQALALAGRGARQLPQAARTPADRTDAAASRPHDGKPRRPVQSAAITSRGPACRCGTNAASI